MNTIDLVSQQLFDLFREIVPPPAEWARARKGKKTLRAEDFVEPLKRFHDRARALRAEHRLGVLGRARVVLNLQHRLSVVGYPNDMTRQVLFSLVLAAFVGKV
jgi:hypothetical protein